MKNLFKSDQNNRFNEILFENRNKNYGAYELRKHYKRRLLKAIAGTFIISGGIACISFFVNIQAYHGAIVYKRLAVIDIKSSL